MKGTNPKLPGMPGPSKEVIAAHDRLHTAVAEVHRALSTIVESLPPTARSEIKLRFEVMGDTLDISIRPKEEKS